MKRLIGITTMGVLVMANSVNATTINSVTSESITLNQGYTLTKSGDELHTVLENISAPYNANTLHTQESIATHRLSNKVTGTITVVTAETAIVREQPTPESDIIQFIKQDIPVYVSEQIDNFYKIEIEGIEGYIYKEQVDQTSLGQVPYTRSEANALPEEKPVYLGDEVVNYAKQFLGNPYVYGGTSLTRGTDCSGFTQQIYKHFGITIERTSRSQYAANGYAVKKADLLPGDLVFYGHNGYIDHVAIYAGNGQIIHANSPRTGICMGRLEYGKPIIGIKRVI